MVYKNLWSYKIMNKKYYLQVSEEPTKKYEPMKVDNYSNTWSSYIKMSYGLVYIQI
jgi:hypothetical protein